MNVTILLVEDSENDVFFFKRALKKIESPVLLQIAPDGREALRYLRGEGRYADRLQYPWPRLVLLDLQLPYVPGLHVLKQIRADPNLRKLVVVVFTSSAADSDMEQAYEWGANSYLVKPATLGEREELVRRICQYWIESNRYLPSWRSAFDSVSAQPEP